MFPNASAEFEAEMLATPAPTSVAVRVGFDVESVVTVRNAVRAPTVVGEKVTVTVQVLPSESEVQLLVWEKSVALVPLMATLEMVTVEAKVVVFVIVTVCEVELPI